MSYRHGQTHQWWRDDYCPLDALFSPALSDTLIKTHTHIHNLQYTIAFSACIDCLQRRRLTLCSSIDSIHCCLCSGSCALRYHTLSFTLMSNRHSSNSWGWKEEEKSGTDQSGSLVYFNEVWFIPPLYLWKLNVFQRSFYNYLAEVSMNNSDVKIWNNIGLLTNMSSVMPRPACSH